MKWMGVVTLVLLNAVSLLPGQADRWRGTSDFAARFDDVDYAGLEDQARKRRLDIPESAIARRVRRNFQHVFMNCLNRQRFLAEPSPREVAGKVETILDLNDRLNSLVVEGRRLAVDEDSMAEAESGNRRRALMREMERTADELKKVFSDNFVDLRQASYNVSISRDRSRTTRFLLFVLQADRICRTLTDHLNDYFFPAAPGAVAVSDLDDASVEVLAEALVKLCELNRKST